MKKVLDLLEYIIIYIFGGLILNFGVTVAQVITYNVLGLLLSFTTTFVSNLKSMLVIYTAVYIFLVVINIMYNLYFVNKLNNSLKNYTRR